MGVRGEDVMQVHDGIYNHFSKCSLVKGGEVKAGGMAVIQAREGIRNMDSHTEKNGLNQNRHCRKADRTHSQIVCGRDRKREESSMILDYGLGTQVEGRLPSWHKAILISDGDRAKGSGWLQVPFKTFQIPSLWTVCGIQKQMDATPKCWFCHEGPRPH